MSETMHDPLQGLIDGGRQTEHLLRLYRLAKLANAMLREQLKYAREWARSMPDGYCTALLAILEHAPCCPPEERALARNAVADEALPDSPTPSSRPSPHQEQIDAAYYHGRDSGKKFAFKKYERLCEEMNKWREYWKSRAEGAVKAPVTDAEIDEAIDRYNAEIDFYTGYADRTFTNPAIRHLQRIGMRAALGIKR